MTSHAGDGKPEAEDPPGGEDVFEEIDLGNLDDVQACIALSPVMCGIFALELLETLSVRASGQGRSPGLEER